MLNSGFRNIVFLFFIALQFCSLDAYSQQYDWVIQQGDTADEYIEDIQKDSQGNYYIIGYFSQGAADIGGVSLTSPLNFGNGVFIAKYDAAHQFLWAINPVTSALSVGGANTFMRMRHLVIDDNDNLFISGEYRGDLTVAGMNMVSQNTGGLDGFLMKLDALGTGLWFRSIGSTTSAYLGSGSYALRLDQNQNVFWLFGWDGTTNFNGVPRVSAGWTDYALVSYDNNGNYRWEYTMGTPNHDNAASFNIGPAGDVYFAGEFNWPSITVGGVTYTNIGGSTKIMLAFKFSNAGNLIWGNHTESGNTTGMDVADVIVNGFDEVFITANHNFQSSPIFSDGSAPFPTWTYGNGPLIMKIDGMGTFQGAKRFGPRNTSYPRLSSPLLELDSCNQDLYMYGHASGSPGDYFYFDNDSLLMRSSNGAGTAGRTYYIAKYDQNLNNIWVFQMDSLESSGSSGMSSTHFVMDGPANQLVITGTVGGSGSIPSLYFGNTAITPNGENSDIWMARFNLNSVVYQVHASPDTICSGQMVDLIVDSAYVLPGSQLVWYEDACGNGLPIGYGDTLSIWVDTTKNYSVRVEGPCDTSNCMDISVVYLDASQPNFVLDSICPGATLVLYPSISALPYTWSDGSILDSLIIDTAGYYWVDMQFTNCTIRDSFEITYPNINLPEYTDTLICPNSSIVLDGIDVTASSYLWNTGSINPAITINMAGYYWVDKTINQCTVRDSFFVLEKNFPAGVNIGLSICPETYVLLYATPPNAQYLWQNGSTAGFISTQDSGTYWVDVSLGGCTKRDTFLVSFNALPNPVITSLSWCVGDSLALQASNPNATSFLWSSGNLSSSDTVVAAGVYWVKTTVGGCIMVDSFYVNSTLVPESFTHYNCLSTGVVLTANDSADNYLWDNGSTGQSITVLSSGVYTVERNKNTCSVTDTFTVLDGSVLQNGRFVDTLLCNGASIDLIPSLQHDSASYLWNDNSLTNHKWVNGFGLYWVEVYLGECVLKDTFLVSNEAIVLNLADDTIICSGESVVLDPGQGFSNYLWDDGSMESYLNINRAGEYTVSVQGVCGVYADSIVVREEDCGCLIYIPEAFSPNGDGLNEGFFPVTFCDFEHYLFNVYNRWGDLIFSSDIPLEEWDGKFAGKFCPEGVYVWQLKFQRKGHSNIEDQIQFGKVVLIGNRQFKD